MKNLDKRKKNVYLEILTVVVEAKQCFDIRILRTYLGASILIKIENYLEKICSRVKILLDGYLFFGDKNFFSIFYFEYRCHIIGCVGLIRQRGPT